jgi:hypothetical protein
MKEKKITVLKVEPHKHPEVCILENDLDSLQKAVSIGADYQGLIEIFAIDDDVAILANEEAKLIGLEPNRHFYNDILCGVFYVCGENDDGELTSLSPAMQDRYTRLFWDPEDILPEDAAHSIFTRFISM